MNNEQLKVLSFIQKIATVGLILGAILFVGSFFASGYNDNYLLTAIGIGIIASSMSIFGFWLFSILFDGKCWENSPRKHK